MVEGAGLWGGRGPSIKYPQLHLNQSVLFFFYLQFPETEQNNFLYTYKAQKEKTMKLSKKRRKGWPAPWAATLSRVAWLDV